MTDLLRPGLEQIRQAPKVLLHDHLDGGLRPQTLLELADESGYEGLPARSADALEREIHREAQGSDLPGYLGTFRHVVEALQTQDALARVGRECVDDLADDGVVYAEVRFAPEAHTSRGLSVDEGIEAVLAGLDRAKERGIEVGLICTALRHQPNSLEVARAAARWVRQGVVGFDLAGPELGYPLTDHLDASQHAKEHGLGLTLHAGEAGGLESIADALDLNAARIGHGVRIIEDIDITLEPPRLGRLAERIADRGVVLEICPTSNVHTGIFSTIATHPVNTLLEIGMKVTINTDNRLISGVSITSEFVALVEHLGWGWKQIESTTLNAIDAGFGDEARRRQIRATRIEPWYRALRDPISAPVQEPDRHGGD